MKRLVRLFSVALFMSFVVSVFYYKVITPEPMGTSTHRGSRIPKCDEDRVLVVVSEFNRYPGDGKIDESSVKRIKYPEKLLPRYAPLCVRDVLGKAVDERVYRGEIINLQRLVEVHGNGNPVGVSKDRTIRTLVISDGQGFSSVLVRGLYVDIAAQYFCLPHGKSEPVEVCRTIVRKARVIEYENDALRRLDNKELATDNKAVTFELAKQAAAVVDLVKGQPGTSFYIILRSANNSDDPDTEGFGVDQLEDRSVKRTFEQGEGPKPFELSKMKSSRKELRDSYWKKPMHSIPVDNKEKADSFDGADFGDFGDDDDEDEYDDSEFDEFDEFDGF